MPDQPALADALAKHMCEIDACTDPAPCFDHLTVAGVALKFLGNTVDAAYQRGLAEGRTEATVGWKHEWALKRSGSFGVYGFRNEATARVAAERNPELTLLARLVGPWEPAEQTEAAPVVERLSAETIASTLAIVDAPYRPGLDVKYLDEEPVTGGVVEPSGPPTTEETHQGYTELRCDHVKGPHPRHTWSHRDEPCEGHVCPGEQTAPVRRQHDPGALTEEPDRPWPICYAEHRGMLCDRQRGHQGDHVDIYGPLPDHTWPAEQPEDGRR